MMRYSLFVVALSGLMYSNLSCTREDAKSVSEILMDGQWRLLYALADPAVMVNGVPVSIIPIEVESCDADDPWFFLENNQMEIRDGATKCDPADPDVKGNGTWFLSNGDAMITLDIFGTPVTFGIDKINQDEFLLKIPNPADFLDSEYPTDGSYFLVWTNLN